MRHHHVVLQMSGDAGLQLILHSDHLHFLRVTAFVWEITGHGFVLDIEFTAPGILF